MREIKIFSNNYFVFALLAIVSVLVFSPIIQAEFLNWDDQEYILKNAMIHKFSLENIQLIFSSYYMGNYHPLTLLSYNIEYVIFGDTAITFHITNLILHIINGFLVFLLLKRIFNNKQIALLGAFIFSLQAIHVESVAWISARKDLLYSLFFLLSLLSYFKFSDNRKKIQYLLALLFFVLAVLSKAMAVSFFICIFLLDLLKGEKIFTLKSLIEKLPFLLISIIVGVVAIYAQQSKGAIEHYIDLSLFERFGVASYGLANYILQSILPVNLNPLYTYPDSIPWYYYALSIFGIILTIVGIWKRKTVFGFGILFFIANVLLVLQIIPVGRAMMADRYAYLASIGICIVICAGINTLIEKKKILTAIKFLLSIIIGFNAFQAFKYSKQWKNTETFWSYALKRDSKNYIAAFNLATFYIENQKINKSTQLLNNAIANKPDFYEALFLRGTIYSNIGDYSKSLADYNQAIKLKPDISGVYINRGNLYRKMTLPAKALLDYNQAIKLNQTDKNYFYRALAYDDLKEYHLAIRDYNKALKINPQNKESRINRALDYSELGFSEKAIEDYTVLLKNDSQKAEVWYLRGLEYMKLEKLNEARSDLNKAAELGFSDAKGVLLN